MQEILTGNLTLAGALNAPDTCFMTYAHALREVLNEGNPDRRKLLEHFMAQPEQTLGGDTATELMGYKHFVRVNQLMGQIGFGVYKKTGRHPDPEIEKEGNFQGQTVISIRGDDTDGSYPWKLRPEIVAALVELGFNIHEEATSLPEEIALQEVPKYLEGRLRPVWVNAFERNALARQECLEAYGYRCACCGIDMQHVYRLSKPFVHVHHLRELSSIRRSYLVDPIKDLRPVCPNCHAVIHLSNPPLSVEALKTQLEAVANKK